MSGTVLTIDGSDVTVLLKDQDAIDFDPQITTRGTLRATLIDRTASGYRPVFGDAIEVTIDSVLTFGGIVMVVVETIQASDTLRMIEVQATDYTVLLDRAMFNGIAGSDSSTLRDIIDILILQVAADGVTRDPTMAAGPTIGAQGFDFKTIREAFTILTTLTGYTFHMDPLKVVYWAGATTLTAPFDLDASTVLDDQISVRREGTQYANAVWLQFGAPGVENAEVTLFGDGSTRLFPLGMVAAATPFQVSVGVDAFPVGVYGIDSAPSFVYFYREVDPFFPYSIIQDVSQPVLTSSDAMTVKFPAQYPSAVLATDPTAILDKGTWVIVVRDQSIYDIGVARASADGILRSRLALPAQVTLSTWKPGLAPLMGPEVTWPTLGLSGNFLVTSIRPHRITAEQGRDTSEHWVHQIELLEGNEFKNSWASYFFGLQDSTGSGGGGFATVPIGGVSPGFVAYAEWGGSRQVGVSGTAAWVDAREWRDVVLSASTHVNVRVDRRTDHASVSVTARIYDYTDNAPVAGATGAASTSTSWAEEILSFDGIGGHRYRLQVQPGISSNDHEVYVVGVGA